MPGRITLRPSKRSFTDNHSLLPNRGQSGDTFVSPVPTNKFSAWTFGRGTIWRIWPAVLLHTCVAATVVLISHQTPYNLAIPNVLVTVAGVVIGFVISYRASSGYDRYWQGRTMWSDLIKNARTIGRLIWLHVPNTVSKPEIKISEKEKAHEAELVVAEKRVALGLVEGFAVALKHHLRGEPGIYYEDLYYLVTTVPHISQQFSTTSPTTATFAAGPSTSARPGDNPHHQYGTFRPPLDTNVNGLTSFPFPSPPSPTPSHPLLPTNRPPPTIPKPSRSVFPFTSLVVPFTAVLGLFSWVASKTTKSGSGQVSTDPEQARGPEPHTLPTRNVQRKFTFGRKYYPLVAGESELNVPLAILRRLSEWVAVLDARGTAGGAAIGGILGCISTFEDQLSGLEKILTTPLPFVYSVHIRHTVWLYLFFLPFQLTETFGYWTIFGVSIAAFMFLGLLAAGEEIEQPFGYDENDLDLDLFITEILHRDLQSLMDMWPYKPQTPIEEYSSGASEIRRVVDAPIDVGDEIGVNEEGRVEGSARMAGRVDEI